MVERAATPASYQLAPAVRWEWLFEEAVVIHTETGWTASLNLSAGLVLEMLGEQLTIAEVVQELVDADIERTIALEAVRSTVETLVEAAVLLPGHSAATDVIDPRASGE